MLPLERLSRALPCRRSQMASNEPVPKYAEALEEEAAPEVVVDTTPASGEMRAATEYPPSKKESKTDALARREADEALKLAMSATSAANKALHRALNANRGKDPPGEVGNGEMTVPLARVNTALAIKERELREESEITFSGKLCGGLMADIKKRARVYVSDWRAPQREGPPAHPSDRLPPCAPPPRRPTTHPRRGARAQDRRLPVQDHLRDRAALLRMPRARHRLRRAAREVHARRHGRHRGDRLHLHLRHPLRPLRRAAPPHPRRNRAGRHLRVHHAQGAHHPPSARPRRRLPRTSARHSRSPPSLTAPRAQAAEGYLGVPFLVARLWTGVWISIILGLCAVTDMCYLIKYITRFTDEIFAVRARPAPPSSPRTSSPVPS